MINGEFSVPYKEVTTMPKAVRFPELMNTTQAAEFLGVDVYTLRKWARDGSVRAYKVGPKLWRFQKSELLSIEKKE